MSCAACLGEILEEIDLISCIDQKCKKSYHVLCTNAGTLTPAQVECWTCPDCRAKARKGRDNTHTPARSDNYVTIRKNLAISQESPLLSPTLKYDCLMTPTGPTMPIATKSTDQTDNIPALVSEIRLLRQTMLNLQKDINTRLDSIAIKFLEYDSRIKALEEYKNENILLRTTVEELQANVNNQSQMSLKNELEIIGLAELPNENPYHLVITTAQKIGVEIADYDVDYVSRAGARKKENSEGSQPQSRPLVVSFTRRSKRDEFLKEAKTRRSLVNDDIVGSGPNNKVYVNDRLTSANRRLFRIARARASAQGYKFCWFKNGSIFIRKRDWRDGSPSIRITSEKDLERIVSPISPNKNEE